jgi:hypothetical protein
MVRRSTSRRSWIWTSGFRMSRRHAVRRIRKLVTEHERGSGREISQMITDRDGSVHVFTARAY